MTSQLEMGCVDVNLWVFSPKRVTRHFTISPKDNPTVFTSGHQILSRWTKIRSPDIRLTYALATPFSAYFPYRQASITMSSNDTSPIWTEHDRRLGPTESDRHLDERVAYAPYTDPTVARTRHKKTTIRRKVDTSKISLENSAYSFAFDLPNLKNRATSIGRDSQDISSTYFALTIPWSSGGDRFCVWAKSHNP
jgi:hypothetical protein